MSNNMTVFIVDDDEAVRQSTRWLIESIGLTVKTYESAETFLENYQEKEIGCLIMDIRMPGISGLDAQDQMKQRNIRLPIIFITGHGDVPMAVRALKSGASDFLEKPFNDQMLLDCVQKALKQAEKIQQENALHETINKRLKQLTPREKEVMEGVVQGKANKVIAFDLGVSSKTVEVHRAKVMEKMQAHSVAELVKMAYIEK